MPIDEIEKIENTKKRFDVLYYETRENEMEIMNKISIMLKHHITEINEIDTLEKLSNIYKNIKG